MSFSNNVQVQDLHDWEKAPELILEEVRRAIQRHALGDEAGYNKLKSLFDAKDNGSTDITPATLRKYTTALLNSVSSLNKSYSALVHAVLSSKWLGSDEDYFKIYVRLVVNIVSVHGNFLEDALGMLVENLGIGMTQINVVDAGPKLTMWLATPSNGQLPESPLISRAQAHSRVHYALQCLLGAVPSASFTLCSILVNQFPHQDDSPRSHLLYVQNLFQVLTYAPALQNDLLSLVIERLVKIDVQVQVDYEDLEADGKDELAQEIAFTGNNKDKNFDDVNDTGDDTDTSDDEADEDAQRTKSIRRNASKVDMLLEVLFKRYDRDFKAASATARHAAQDALLSQFMTIILPTQRSRHTQFLLFHFAQTSSDFIDTFVGTCISTAFDKKQPANLRQAGAAYLASFVARGVHVSPSIVRDVFDLLSIELDKLRAQYEPDCRGPHLGRYAPYYCLVQAAMYIFCFRWRDLEYDPDVDEEDNDSPSPYGIEHHWRSGVKETFTRNIFGTKLNPLKVCQPDLVEQFAEVARQLDIIYVFGLIEANKRIHFAHLSNSRMGAYGQPCRETALSSRKDDEHHHLDAFFPFDPIMLPRSKKWVEGDCREWSGPPKRPSDESASDSEDLTDSEVEEGTATDASRDSA